MGDITDTFTNSNGTAITSHDANWTFSEGAGGVPATQSNELEWSAFAQRCYYYAAAANDFAEIDIIDDGVNNNTGGGPAVLIVPTTQGYGLGVRFTTATGGNFTVITIEKDRAFFTTITGLSISQASHPSLAIEVTGISGSDVTVDVLVNGSSVGGATITSAAETTGNDGLHRADGGSNNFTSQYDNFTNVVAGAAATPKGPLGMVFHGPFGGPV